MTKQQILKRLVDIIVENTGESIRDKDCPKIVDGVIDLLIQEGYLVGIGKL